MVLWLAPWYFRCFPGSFDRGSLGLSRQWAGQTPAEAAARERLRAVKVTETLFF